MRGTPRAAILFSLMFEAVCVQAAAFAFPAAMPQCSTGSSSTAAAAAMEELRQSGFSGSVVITQNAVPEYCGSGGEAAPGVMFSVDTAADVGSIAKPVTALAILSLERDGKLSLEDPLSHWFPSAPVDKAKITIRQMLSHTSGFPEYIDGVTDYDRVSDEELVRRVFLQPLASSPGSGFGYSNPAYNLLALIVAKASGQSYFNYVEHSVFEPAGISGTFEPWRLSLVALARSEKGWDAVADVAHRGSGPFWALWGAGGLFMSATDLARLMDAFTAGEILPMNTVFALREPVVSLNERNAAGLVWGLTRAPGEAWSYYFNGSSEFGSADIRHNPDTGRTIAVTSNSRKTDAIRAGRLIAARAAAAGDEPAARLSDAAR